jgi:RimJ/RimL family protein N-acetyltransferase
LHGANQGSCRPISANAQSRAAKLAMGMLSCGRLRDNVRGGTCGFKQASHEGVVEIAYFTFPEFEGRQYATLMAKEIIEIFGWSKLVPEVITHTSPERNASCTVLGKVRLRFVRELIDPDDGPVWRCERKLVESKEENCGRS